MTNFSKKLSDSYFQGLESPSMEAISPYKSDDIGNSKKTNPRFISGFSFQSSNFQEEGGSQASPPFLSHSYRPFSLQQPPLPPLLPLPEANHHRRATIRGLSSPPDNRKIYNNTRTRDSSRTLNPKKAKSSNYPKKERKPSHSASVTPAAPSGPARILLPENGTKVSPSINIISSNNNVSTVSKKYRVEPCDKFSGSVTFVISPPPSSLPLPTFSLRPNLSCMAEAAGIDSGATDNLRRLLRIQ